MAEPSENQAAAQAAPDLAQTKPPRGPGCFYWVAIVVVLAAIAAFLALSMKKVEPDQIGLRVVKLGFGIWENGAEHARPLETGWHVIVPYCHEFVVYQKSLQTFEMTSKTGGLRKPDYNSLEVRTSDGYRVSVDITIFYHIDAAHAGLVRAHYRDDREIKEKGIQALAPGVIQNKLSELQVAQDFYNSKLRTEKTEAARNELNKYFNPQGVEIADIMVRDFEFPQEYEAAILRKVLADQLKRVQEALAGAAAAEAGWKKAIAEGDRDAQIERTRGEADAMRIQSEGERARTEMVAEGDKAKLLAEGKGKGQVVNALGGPGGKVYVGLEYSKVLKGAELMILPAGKGGINPLDAGAMLRMVEGK
jgi:regulator of protease activity HflC (stomatin/prohibitin superfamily)